MIPNGVSDEIINRLFVFEEPKSAELSNILAVHTEFTSVKVFPFQESSVVNAELNEYLALIAI